MYGLVGIEQFMAELRTSVWSHLQGRPRNACCLKRAARRRASGLIMADLPSSLARINHKVPLPVLWQLDMITSIYR